MKKFILLSFVVASTQAMELQQIKPTFTRNKESKTKMILNLIISASKDIYPQTRGGENPRGRNERRRAGLLYIARLLQNHPIPLENINPVVGEIVGKTKNIYLAHIATEEGVPEFLQVWFTLKDAQGATFDPDQKNEQGQTLLDIALLADYFYNAPERFADATSAVISYKEEYSKNKN